MKHLVLASTLACLLAACAGNGTSTNGSTSSTASNLGKSLIQSYARNQCSTELNKRQEWRLVALAVSAEQQQKWEEQICGCVSEEAPNSVTVAEVTQAAIDANARTQIVANAVNKTVTACLNRLVK